MIVYLSVSLYLYMYIHTFIYAHIHLGSQTQQHAYATSRIDTRPGCPIVFSVLRSLSCNVPRFAGRVLYRCTLCPMGVDHGAGPGCCFRGAAEVPQLSPALSQLAPMNTCAPPISQVAVSRLARPPWPQGPAAGCLPGQHRVAGRPPRQPRFAAVSQQAAKDACAPQCPSWLGAARAAVHGVASTQAMPRRQ